MREERFVAARVVDAVDGRVLSTHADEDVELTDMPVHVGQVKDSAEGLQMVSNGIKVDLYNKVAVV